MVGHESMKIVIEIEIWQKTILTAFQGLHQRVEFPQMAMKTFSLFWSNELNCFGESECVEWRITCEVSFFYWFDLIDYLLI